MEQQPARSAGMRRGISGWKRSVGCSGLQSSGGLINISTSRFNGWKLHSIICTNKRQLLIMCH